MNKDIENVNTNYPNSPVKVKKYEVKKEDTEEQEIKKEDHKEKAVDSE